MRPVFREYEPHELGRDGYPLAWHRDAGVPPDTFDGVKDLVRAEAGYRCVRCGHPYRPGCGTWEEVGGGEMLDEGNDRLFDGVDDGEAQAVLTEAVEVRGKLWSPCDGRCAHGGPVRVLTTEGWRDFDPQPGSLGVRALRSDWPDAPIEAAWRILTVHHLNGRKHDLRWWNLAALCQRCHLYIQRKVAIERVFPFEHTEWFRPYAAGWYAYAYLGESLTREETMERLDELLALERMA